MAFISQQEARYPLLSTKDVRPLQSRMTHINKGSNKSRLHRLPIRRVSAGEAPFSEGHLRHRRRTEKIVLSTATLFD